jgi:hypothetical protein
MFHHWHSVHFGAPFFFVLVAIALLVALLRGDRREP